MLRLRWNCSGSIGPDLSSENDQHVDFGARSIARTSVFCVSDVTLCGLLSVLNYRDLVVGFLEAISEQMSFTPQMPNDRARRLRVRKFVVDRHLDRECHRLGAVPVKTWQICGQCRVQLGELAWIQTRRSGSVIAYSMSTARVKRIPKCGAGGDMTKLPLIDRI
jgi:hypothetical protein